MDRDNNCDNSYSALEASKTNSLLRKLKSNYNNATSVLSSQSYLNETASNRPAFKMPYPVIKSSVECESCSGPKYTGPNITRQKVMKNFNKALSLVNRSPNIDEAKLIALYSDLTCAVWDVIETVQEKTLSCIDSSMMNGASAGNVPKCSNYANQYNSSCFCGSNNTMNGQENVSHHGTVFNGGPAGSVLKCSNNTNQYNPSYFCSSNNTMNSQVNVSHHGTVFNGSDCNIIDLPNAIDSYLNPLMKSKHSNSKLIDEARSLRTDSPVLAGNKKALNDGKLIGLNDSLMVYGNDRFNFRKPRHLNAGPMLNKTLSKNNTPDKLCLPSSSKSSDSLIGFKVASKTRSNQEIRDWYILKRSNSMVIELYGRSCTSNGKANPKFDVVGVVRSRLSASMVKTDKGIVILIGPMYIKDGIPLEIIRMFKNGFPIMWRKAIIEAEWVSKKK